MCFYRHKILVLELMTTLIERMKQKKTKTRKLRILINIPSCIILGRTLLKIISLRIPSHTLANNKTEHVEITAMNRF